jgi:hypothetical protein
VLDWLNIVLPPAGNHQMRGKCPIHGGDGLRDFVVTPGKGLWYCFAGCGGGDIIKLVARVKKVEQKEAAQLIAEQFDTEPKGTVPKTAVSTVPQNQKGQLKPLDYLQPEHELVQAVGISPETCQAFGAGYAPKGIMRGRLAIPIRARDGTLLAYVGRRVNGAGPLLMYPNGFDPAAVIFGADRVSEGTLYLVRDPLQVLTAYEAGIENVVALMDEITPQLLEQVAALMDEKRCGLCDFFNSAPA